MLSRGLSDPELFKLFARAALIYARFAVQAVRARMWVRRVRSPPKGACTVYVPTPLARALLEKSEYVLVAEEGGRLVVRPAPRELVERALREVGPRLIWTRGIYKLIAQRHHGLTWRLTLPRQFLRGARYVLIRELPEGFEVEPLPDAAGAVVEVLRGWAERAGGGPARAR
jgi:hypothetical protein